MRKNDCSRVNRIANAHIHSSQIADPAERRWSDGKPYSLRVFRAEATEVRNYFTILNVTISQTTCLVIRRYDIATLIQRCKFMRVHLALRLKVGRTVVFVVWTNICHSYKTESRLNLRTETDIAAEYPLLQSKVEGSDNKTNAWNVGQTVAAKFWIGTKK